jgi:FkbM family methyltransferase
MRATAARWADALGARAALDRGRAGLVDLLNGDRRTAVERRNQEDDRHLRLLLRFGLRPSSNCLDVGANRGTFLREMYRLAPLGHHIAYEPIPRLAERLAREFPGVDVRQRALADVDGTQEFVEFLDPGYVTLSGLADHLEPGTGVGSRARVTTMATERLDDHRPDGWLPDLVKIDVEGAELSVLEGAVDTLRAARPVLAFEHGLHPGQSEELYRLVCQDVGLRLFTTAGDGPLDRSAFLDGLATRWNWVAHE